MTYVALFRDALREALDRKSLHVLLALSALLVLLCASLSVTPLGERQALQAIADRFNLVSPPLSSGQRWHREYPVAFEVGEVQLKPGGQNVGHRFRLTASPPAEAHLLFRHAWGVLEKKCVLESDPVPDAGQPSTLEQQKRVLTAAFRSGLIRELSIEPAGPLAWDMEVRVAGRRSLQGAEEMGFLFGLVRWRPRNEGGYVSTALTVYQIQLLLVDAVAGIGWMVVALIVTGGSIPAMLQKGTVDVLLAKPVSRATLLVCKYLGGITYILIAGTFLIGGCWVAVSARTGYWNFHLPLAIPVLGFLFAVVYSVSVLVGVLTRSGGLAAFLAIGVWLLCSSVGRGHLGLETTAPEHVPKGVGATVRAAYLVLPRTFDLGRLNRDLCAKATFGREEVAALTPAWLPPLDLPATFGVSAAFAAAMIALASLQFAKRDY